MCMLCHNDVINIYLFSTVIRSIFKVIKSAFKMSYDKQVVFFTFSFCVKTNTLIAFSNYIKIKTISLLLYMPDKDILNPLTQKFLR